MVNLFQSNNFFLLSKKPSFQEVIELQKILINTLDSVGEYMLNEQQLSTKELIWDEKVVEQLQQTQQQNISENSNHTNQQTLPFEFVQSSSSRSSSAQKKKTSETKNQQPNKKELNLDFVFV